VRLREVAAFQHAKRARLRSRASCPAFPTIRCQVPRYGEAGVVRFRGFLKVPCNPKD
jgi:hypothetical protein